MLFLILYYMQLLSVPAFSDPLSHWLSSAPRRPPSANGGAPGTRRELYLGTTPHSRPAPGEDKDHALLNPCKKIKRKVK